MNEENEEKKRMLPSLIITHFYVFRSSQLDWKALTTHWTLVGGSLSNLKPIPAGGGGAI